MSAFRFTPLMLNVIKRQAALRRNAAAIAGDLKCSPGTVEDICKLHGIELVDIADGAPPLSPYRAKDGSRPNYRTIEITLPLEVVERLQSEAMRRGVKYTRLIERVCEIVATDRLFAAVLDQ